MAKYRRGRVNEAVTNEVSQIVREIKDPRLAGLMLTITGADVTPDLKFAKVFYSVIGEHEPKETAKALRSAATFVRSQLARRLNMRNTPDISFIFDESVERGAHLNEIFRSIERTSPADGANETDDLKDTDDGSSTAAETEGVDGGDEGDGVDAIAEVDEAAGTGEAEGADAQPGE